jgi:phage terminase large subunit-like protein
MVRLACQRYLDDHKRDDLYFDWLEVQRFVAFSAQLKHFKGELAGQYIRLEPWQIFIAANIFGWKCKATKRRRFTYADVFVPRKNGKTTFASVIALYCMILDGEAGAEVYAAAVDREQAKICFEASKELIRGSIFERVVKIYTNSLVYGKAASSYKPLSKDSKNKDGLNPSCAICDERHAWANNAIYEVLKTGVGARSQPLIFSISTAGTDTSLPYFTDVQVLKDVMLGIKEKDNHFIMLYQPDEEDAWDDPMTWQKVNPNYGISLSASYMENEYLEAKMRGGSTLAAFCTKNINMWVDAPEVWISDDTVRDNNSDLDESLLLGEECYVGLDLASKSDLTAAAFFFPKYMAFKILFIVPEAKVTEQEDRVDYRRWHEQGWLTVSPGKVIDEDWYMSRLLQELDKYKVKSIAYDPWGMWNMLQKFGRYQEYLMEYQQSIRFMSVPTKWFESAVLKNELNFMHNPILRWNMKNVVIYTDPNANIKLDKARSRNKIDGVVACVDAIGAWLNLTSGKTGEIYVSHGLRTVSIGV